MTEEARAVYIYDLDHRLVSEEDIHDWLSQGAPSGVKAVTTQYDGSSRQMCFRAVLASAELANAVLNHLDGHVFKSGACRIVSTVFSKALATTVSSANAPAAAAAMASADPSASPSAAAEGGANDAVGRSAVLPHNHLVPPIHQLMPQLAAWADTLAARREEAERAKAVETSAATGADGSDAGAGASSAASLPPLLGGRLAALAALQERLIGLVAQRDALKAAERAATGGAASDEADADAEGAADGSSSAVDEASADGAMASLQTATRDDAYARTVEARATRGGHGQGHDWAGRLLGLVARAVGPVESAVFASGGGGGGASREKEKSASTLLVTMAFAEDAEALVRLGGVGGLSSWGRGGGGGGQAPLPSVRTALSRAANPLFSWPSSSHAAAEVPASSSFDVTADVGSVLQRVIGAGGDGPSASSNNGGGGGGGDDEAALYVERLAMLQSAAVFGRPTQGAFQSAAGRTIATAFAAKVEALSGSGGATTAAADLSAELADLLTL